ncbi:tetratricopeptide repeat protein [Altererythrobacter ishigakiensis]|uniref:Uncharacterized protein n=1 Tax=Altererythrobacter ishigakiensis TaxID=476157 RepID=A0A562UW23_9SPHN|nr:tetratricopeptide repeat protein [Altererythrobacter ishigakiensis]TWJ09787.1 hypothetical protein JN10_1433 [Altererythrobacter ishigakiensis]
MRIKIFILAIAVLIAASSTAHSQTLSIEEFEQEYGSLDGWEGGNIARHAAENGEWLVEQLKAEGAEEDIIRTEQCRIARNLSLAGLVEEAREAIEAALIGLEQLAMHTKVSCKIDQTVVLRQSARSKEALSVATLALSDAQKLPQAEQLLVAKATTELALTLLAERQYSEASALHQRALELASEAGREGLPIALRNQISLVDIGLQKGELKSLLPVLHELLEITVNEYGETSLWTAELLERLGGIEVALKHLELGGRMLELASDIRSPDPVGVQPEEYRAWQISEIVRQQLEMASGSKVMGTGYGPAAVSPVMAFRSWRGIAHSDRIEVLARHVSSELAVSRHPNGSSEGSGFFGGEGAFEAHHISREALTGLIERMRTLGVDSSLPDRFNPLGRLSPRDVVFAHLDALWFDTYERTTQGTEFNAN